MLMRVVWAISLAAATACRSDTSSTPDIRDNKPQPQPVVPRELPEIGTGLANFPDGDGKDLATASCLACHSADIPRQQRLTEKQWTAVVDKMVRWGTEVPEDRKAALVSYLAAHFGPDNTGFEPVVTRPVDVKP